MVNFIIGVFIGIIFDIAFNEVYKEKQWSKWTLDDFEENQKIETQKFIVFKREQENERDKS